MDEISLAASAISGLATGFGGLLAAAAGKARRYAAPALMGLSAGIGIEVAVIDMLPGSLKSGSWVSAAVGVLSGIAIGALARFLFPHILNPGCRSHAGTDKDRTGNGLLRTGYLFALGVALHNLPEGAAIGVCAEPGHVSGVKLAASVGLHNIPEGMAMCGVILAAGAGRAFSIIVASGAGLMLPLGSVLAGLWENMAPGAISFAVALGAGMLLFIIMRDLIPEAGRMNPGITLAGLLAGSALSTGLSFFFRL